MNTIRSLTVGYALAAVLLGCWAMVNAGLAQVQYGGRQPGNVPPANIPDPPRQVPAPRGGPSAQDGDSPVVKRTPYRPKQQVQLGMTPEDRGCLTWTQIPDEDGDFKRAEGNKIDLASEDLCLTYDAFEDSGFYWVLQIIQNTSKRQGPLWAVPHDNEDSAFQSAVQSVLKYGGTVVAVEAAGQRNVQGKLPQPQDPNRNFDVGSKQQCKDQVAPSRDYTRRFLRWWDRSQPIIALHTNVAGGSINIKSNKNGRPFPSPTPIGGKNPNHTLVFVASISDKDPELDRFVRTLNQKGVHVIYETVSALRNDCSMSNYAALQNIRNYFNVEVVHGDTDTQLKIVDIIMELWAEQPVGPFVPPSGPTEGDDPGADKGQPSTQPVPPKGPNRRGGG